MLAARLHGRRDVRVERLESPPPPRAGEALVRIGSVGICGSDLHTYQHGRIGDTVVRSPLVLGHEFGGIVVQAGEGAVDGTGTPLAAGVRVAIDPAVPCRACEPCGAGHPNLCTKLAFFGLYPTGGALCERLIVPGWVCFPLPASIPDEHAPLLETLGVALHAVDLAHIRPAASVAVIGAGTIGLTVAQVARVAGAMPLFVTDRLRWRLDLAKHLGARPIDIDEGDPAAAILEGTGGRGVDVAIECAWSSEDAMAQAVEVLRPGGRLVIVGIAGDDRLILRHSTARRKGLTIAMCRRMKHTYPRAIALAESGRVNLGALITHRFPLDEAGDALRLAADYEDGVVKAIVNVRRP